MAETISVRLDKDILKDLSKIEKRWRADRSESVRRLLAEAIHSHKIKNALEMLRQHKISIGKAAEDCGVSLWEMLDIARQENIGWTAYSKSDLEKDLKALEGKF